MDPARGPSDPPAPASPPAPPSGLGGIVGADVADADASPSRSPRRGAPSSGPGLADLAAAAPVRSVHQAISCRPEDVRAPPRGTRGNGVHAGFAGDPRDGSLHHGGSHRNYMALKIQKLAEQHASASNPDALDAGVFAGVRIHVNGITDPSWLELKELMLANGGGFSNYYSRETVTHVVCARLTQRKLEQLARADRRQPPIVTPAWVTESLAAGKRLPEQDFALEGTLEPGQRRVRDVFGASNTKATRRGAPGSKENPPETDEDDDGDDPDATDRSDEDPEVAYGSDEDPEVAYRSDQDLSDHPSDHPSREDTPRPAPIGVPSARVARVVFSTARAALESSAAAAPGERGEKASGAARAAAGAAYGALVGSVEPARIAPVGAWEALVALEPLKRKPPGADVDADADAKAAETASEGFAAAEAEAEAEAARLSAALSAAGVDATVTLKPLPEGPSRPARGDGGDGGIAPSDPPGGSRAFPRAADRSRLKSAMKRRASGPGRGSVRFAASVVDGEIRGGVGGGVGVDAPNTSDAPSTSPSSVRAAGFSARSSFGAAAFAALSDPRSVIDRGALDALPPEIRLEVLAARKRKHNKGQTRLDDFKPAAGDRRAAVSAAATSTRDRGGASSFGSEGESEGVGGDAWSAFAKHLGMRRGARANPGKAARGGEEEAKKTEKKRRSTRRASPAAVGPESLSQCDPEVLDALGEEQREMLRAEFERRKKRARGGETAGGGSGIAATPAAAAAAAATPGGSSSPPSPVPPSSSPPSSPSSPVAAALATDPRGVETATADLAEALTASVDALEARVAAGEAVDSALAGLDAAAALFRTHALALAADPTRLAHTSRLCLAARSLAAKRPSGEWGPRFERAWAETREATRRANARVGLGALGLWGVEDEGARAREGEAQPRGVEIEIEVGPGKRWDAAAENAYVEPIPPPR